MNGRAQSIPRYRFFVNRIFCRKMKKASLACGRFNNENVAADLRDVVVIERKRPRCNVTPLRKLVTTMRTREFTRLSEWQTYAGHCPITKVSDEAQRNSGSCINRRHRTASVLRKRIDRE